MLVSGDFVKGMPFFSAATSFLASLQKQSRHGTRRWSSRADGRRVGRGGARGAPRARQSPFAAVLVTWVPAAPVLSAKPSAVSER